MALSIFADKEKKPTDAELMQALGRSGAHWVGAAVDQRRKADAPRAKVERG
jgi:hypothetical protein